MKSIQLAAGIALSALLCTTAYAGEAQSFSALQGVEAQALSSPEMSSVYGQVTVPELQAAIDLKLANHPVLDAAVDTAIANHPIAAAIVARVVTNRSN